MQGPILAVSCLHVSNQLRRSRDWQSLLEDDVQTVCRLDKADVLDNIVMLATVQHLIAYSMFNRGSYMKVLQKIDFGLHDC
jgi:hypothetical protein